MFYAQNGSWVNAQNIEIWEVRKLKGDLHELVATGHNEHQIHVAPKANCEEVQRLIAGHVEKGYELDLRDRDQEHLEAAKPKPRSRSKSTSKSKTETPAAETDDAS